MNTPENPHDPRNWLPSWLQAHQIRTQPTNPAAKVGISVAALAGEWPLHGLRHLPNETTTGWYLWARDLEDDPHFFTAVCVEHFEVRLAMLQPLLTLPPGWRFLLAPDHHDVWFDPSIVHR